MAPSDIANKLEAKIGTFGHSQIQNFGTAQKTNYSWHRPGHIGNGLWINSHRKQQDKPCRDGCAAFIKIQKPPRAPVFDFQKNGNAYQNAQAYGGSY